MFKKVIILSLVFVLMLIAFAPGAVLGSEEEPQPEPPEEKRSEDNDYAEDIISFDEYDIIIEGEDLISYTYSSISDEGNNTVEMSGTTETNFIVDEIKVELTLQP